MSKSPPKINKDLTLKPGEKNAIPPLARPGVPTAKAPTGAQIRKEDIPLDPLADVNYAGDLETDTMAEFNAIQQGFVQRQKSDQERFRQAVDTEFWFAVCFQTREQKELFLQRFGWHINGDKFIDGTWLAEQYGIEMEDVKLRNKNTRKDERWKSIAVSSDGE